MVNFCENLKKHFEETPIETLKKQWDDVKDDKPIGIKIDDLYDDLLITQTLILQK